MSHRIYGLRKQVTEAKEGPSELGGEREVRVMCLGEGGTERRCCIEKVNLGPQS